MGRSRPRTVRLVALDTLPSWSWNRAKQDFQAILSIYTGKEVDLVPEFSSHAERKQMGKKANVQLVSCMWSSFMGEDELFDLGGLSLNT